MFIKTHSVRQEGGQSMNSYGSGRSNIQINDLTQKSHVRQSRATIDPGRFTDYDPLQHMNEIQKQRMDEKLEKVDMIDTILNNIKNIQLELARIRDETSITITEQSQQSNTLITGKISDFSDQIRQMQAKINQVTVKSDQIGQREQLRDNILQVHDQALTNYTKIIQQLEEKIHRIEAQMIQKDEMEQRIKNVENDMRQLYDQMHGRFSEMQLDTNQNVQNIMGILNMFDQKQKNILLQISQLQMMFKQPQYG